MKRWWSLYALSIPAEADTATGGIDRHAKIFPIMKIVTAMGFARCRKKRPRSWPMKGLQTHPGSPVLADESVEGNMPRQWKASWSYIRGWPDRNDDRALRD